MNGKFNDTELLWIKEVLNQHGDFLQEAFIEEIENKKLKDSGELLGSIDFDVKSYGINPVLTFSFMSYGRAIEIRWHKRSQNTRQWVTDTNKTIWNASRKPRRYRNTLWYARTLYGSQNRLISILSHEFTEEERKRMKESLDRMKILLKT